MTSSSHKRAAHADLGNEFRGCFYLDWRFDPGDDNRQTLTADQHPLFQPNF